MDAASDIEPRRQAAEREVRHGNFQAAIRIYEVLVTEAPEDAHLASRLETLRGLLQPLELTHPKARAGARAAAAENDAQAGEAAANRGDLAGAVAAYERAALGQPGNHLLRERLDELKAMAVAQGIAVDAAAPDAAPPAPAAPAVPAPVVAPPPPVTPSPAPAEAAAPPAEAAPAPPEAPRPPAPLPADPVARLETLLDRVQRRRRPAL